MLLANTAISLQTTPDGFVEAKFRLSELKTIFSVTLRIKYVITSDDSANPAGPKENFISAKKLVITVCEEGRDLR